MALKDTAALNRASFDLLASARRYDPFAIDRITAISMTRSVMRCLTIAAVMALACRRSRRFDAVVGEMERLRKAFHADRFDVMSGKLPAKIIEVLPRCGSSHASAMPLACIGTQRASVHGPIG